MIKYPQIDPVIFHLGPLEPRWYGLMYLIGFIYTHRLLKKNHKWIGLPDAECVDNVLAILVISMIVCSRAVYVTFYNWEETMRGPWWEFLAVWHGGLAFHGGLLGTVIGAAIVCRKYKLRWSRLADVIALSAPVGLGLGRIANFINGELWGRVTDVPWAMIFPTGGPMPRHPSQLYQFLLEGVVLFLVLRFVWSRKPRVGVLTSVFLLTYAFFRISVEFVREPDAQLGFIFGPLTMGQILSFLMVIGGLKLLRHSMTHGALHDAPAQIEAPVQKRKRK